LTPVRTRFVFRGRGRRYIAPPLCRPFLRFHRALARPQPAEPTAVWLPNWIHGDQGTDRLPAHGRGATRLAIRLITSLRQRTGRSAFPWWAEAINHLKVRSCLIDGGGRACDGRRLIPLRRPAPPALQRGASFPLCLRPPGAGWRRSPESQMPIGKRKRGKTSVGGQTGVTSGCRPVTLLTLLAFLRLARPGRLATRGGRWRPNNPSNVR